MSLSDIARTLAKQLSGAPYKIVPKNGKFQVVNNLGEVKGTFDNRDDALKHQRALYVNVPGAKKVADKKDWTGDAKKRTAAKDFSDDKRDKLGKDGKAMKDGSFPIENEADLKNAIQAHGRAKNPAAAKAHIKKRAGALGKDHVLPSDWGK